MVPSVDQGWWSGEGEHTHTESMSVEGCVCVPRGGIEHCELISKVSINVRNFHKPLNSKSLFCVCNHFDMTYGAFVICEDQFVNE